MNITISDGSSLRIYYRNKFMINDGIQQHKREGYEHTLSRTVRIMYYWLIILRGKNVLVIRRKEAKCIRISERPIYSRNQKTNSITTVVVFLLINILPLIRKFLISFSMRIHTEAL